MRSARVEKTHAFRFENACVIISDPDAPTVRVHGLFSISPDWKKLRDALGALLHRFADREFFAPAIWPEKFGAEIFEPLTQSLMRLDSNERLAYVRRSA